MLPSATRLFVLGSLAISLMYGAQRPKPDLERGFSQTVQPFVATYCVGCHGGKPPADTSQEVINWIRAMRTSEAKKNAGDPGPVLARRLSNAEYNYNLHDQT